MYGGGAVAGIGGFFPWEASTWEGGTIPGCIGTKGTVGDFGGGAMGVKGTRASLQGGTTSPRDLDLWASSLCPVLPLLPSDPERILLVSAWPSIRLPP